MNTQDAYTPEMLVKNKRRFRIPLYQRPFAWEAEQVQGFLNDLLQCFNGHAESPYYIGVVSVAHPAVGVDGALDLIDGQQRVTTLALIGRVAKEHAGCWNEFFTRLPIEFYGRKADREFMEGNDRAECNPRMTEAVREIRAFFDSGKLKSRKDFSEYIYRQAAFFISEMPASYSLLDKNQQFVRMNNRGRQLEKHEILKVKLLSKLDSATEQAEAFRVWNEMVACLAGINDAAEKLPGAEASTLADLIAGSNASGPVGMGAGEPLYTAIVNVPEFLLIALARFRPDAVGPRAFDKDRLLENFADLIKGQGREAGEFAKCLKDQTDLLRDCFVFKGKEGEYKFLSRDPGGSPPFGTEDVLERSRLIMAQSFLHVSTEPHHWLIPAFDWLAEQRAGQGNKPPRVTAAEFVRQLEGIDQRLVPEPNAPACGERKRVLSSSKPEAMVYGNISHYWFYRLDYELWKEYHLSKDHGLWGTLLDPQVKDLIRKFRFRPCGSVEHIKPQHAMDAGEEDPAEHSFGNLALISGSRNSKFSNNPPDGKKAIILGSQDPYTESLKMVHFLWCDSNPSTHGKKMCEIL